MGFRFVDIDAYFRSEVAPIPDYVKRHGYAAYCQKNSELADDLVGRFVANTVFATPAGFLVHEQVPHLAEKHIELIDTDATSVLLLPSEDSLESVEMIVDRQLARWPELEPVSERGKYISQHVRYKRYGTLKIIGQYEPDEAVNLVTKQLRRMRQRHDPGETANRLPDS